MVGTVIEADQLGIAEFLVNIGFVAHDFNVYVRETKKKCPSGSKAVVIHVETIHDEGGERLICFVHIGKCSHRVVVNSRSDLLRVIEVFENKEV